MDPAEPTQGDVLNFNRYAYANNNPVVNTDPTGMAAGDMDPFQDRQNNMFRQDSQDSVSAQTSGGSAQVTNLPSVNVRGGASSGQPLERTGRATDAVFSTIFGTAFNEMKRPNHPTKIPDTLAHELFAVNAAGIGLAASPSAVAIGVSSAPVVADGSPVVVGAIGNAAVRYGPRVAVLGCLGATCMGEEQPDQFVKDREVIQEIYEGAKAAGSEVYKQVFLGGKD